MPEMVYVDSSNIEAIGHDADAEELHVLFLSGSIYGYQAVPVAVFEDMMSAPSKGSFLNREIKGVYEFTKG